MQAENVVCSHHMASASYCVCVCVCMCVCVCVCVLAVYNKAQAQSFKCWLNAG